MKFFYAVWKLMRWPNLVFIMLTQFLFWYFVLPFALKKNQSSEAVQNLSPELFLGLVLASVCIAAAGYIINDYFDLNIDQINKPSKVFIGKFIKKRAAFLLYAVLSAAGVALSAYAGFKLNNYYIVFFNVLSILFLWLYSAIFKKKLLIGNILIALLTAWVILVLGLAEYLPADDLSRERILAVTLLYGGFAFILSLVREMIKDMEDVVGDAQFGCTTMPIKWGIRAAKWYTGIWLIILFGFILAGIIYILQHGWWMVSLYAMLTLFLPLIWVLRKLFSARDPVHYHQLSTVVKVIMLAGILSMLFFLYPDDRLQGLF